MGYQVARSRLLIEPEVHHVVVLHDVRFQFKALFAGAFGLRLTARRDEVRKADDLGADEALLNIRVNSPGGLPCRQAGADGPGAIFFSANGQETDIAAVLKR